MNHILFAFHVVAPVFGIIFLGMYLSSRKYINEVFINRSNWLVFRITLPCLIFKNVAASNIHNDFSPSAILYILGSLSLFALIIWGATVIFIKDPKARGAFVQGGFRSNAVIIGLSFLTNLYGQRGIPLYAVFIAFVIPLYNLLTVIILIVSNADRSSVRPRDLFCEIAKNPLIIATVVAVPFSLLQIRLHFIAAGMVDYLAAMTLPLALISIGGSLSAGGLRYLPGLSVAASLLKLIIAPAVLTSGAILLGYRGVTLGGMFLVFASPTAVSSYIMAENMNSDSALSANIIFLTTLFSIITVSIGISVLRAAHLL